MLYTKCLRGVVMPRPLPKVVIVAIGLVEIKGLLVVARILLVPKRDFF